MGWDGTNFTFKMDNEQAQFAPNRSVNPARKPFKALQTRITQSDGREATVDALFDQVKVNAP